MRVAILIVLLTITGLLVNVAWQLNRIGSAKPDETILKSIARTNTEVHKLRGELLDAVVHDMEVRKEHDNAGYGLAWALDARGYFLDEAESGSGDGDHKHADIERNANGEQRMAAARMRLLEAQTKRKLAELDLDEQIELGKIAQGDKTGDAPARATSPFKIFRDLRADSTRVAQK